MRPTPVEVTGDDAELLFTAAQLWAALPFDVYAQCLGADTMSEEVDALRRSRAKLGAAAATLYSSLWQVSLCHAKRVLFQARLEGYTCYPFAETCMSLFQGCQVGNERAERRMYAFHCMGS